MPQLTVAFGVALILTGILVYFGTGRESVTALLPSIAGVPVLLAGVVALRPEWRMYGLYAAAVLVLILALGTLRGVFTLLGGDLTTASVINTGLFLVSILYFIVFVRAIRTGQVQRAE
jgi:hypothetical protein